MEFDPRHMRDGEYVDADFSGTRFRNVNFAGAKVMEAYLVNARFSGLITGLVINDIEVAPLIEAELNRRFPERAQLNPITVPGVRTAWSIIERNWAATRARITSLPEAVLHQRVDGEWSCLETLRHLIFVADGFTRTVLDKQNSTHPFAVAPSFIADPTQLGIDTAADPSADEVIALREERLSTLREFVRTVTDETEPGVRGHLHNLFDEEWQHNWYANRDLDVLTSSNSG